MKPLRGLLILGFHLTVTIVLLVGVPDLCAQQATGKIEGSVTDPMGRPVAGAQVFILGTSFAALTNEAGYYFIINVPAGAYDLRTQFIGFQPAEVRGARVFAGQTLTVNFALSGAVALEAIVISAAEQPIAPRDQVTSKSIVRGEDISALPVDDTRDVLILQPGVVVSSLVPYVLPLSTNFQKNNISIRGGRPGEAAVYVDGVPVRRTLTGTTQLHVATNALEEASVITGALGAEFGDAQSGVISLVTRSGSPEYRASFSYETDEPFGNSVGVGFNRFEGSLSGPVAGNLTFFVGGTITGQKSGFQGKGAENVATYVRGPVDQSVTVPQGNDSVTVDIHHFIQYSGQCSPEENFGFECQGRRLPYNWSSGAIVNGKLSYTYGGGSRVSGSVMWNQDQGRVFPSGHMFNPDAYSGVRTVTEVYTVNWVQQIFRSTDRELAFDLNLSYQRDRQQQGVLDREYELATRDPFLGISLTPVDFLFDFDHFSDDTGDRAVTKLNTQRDWDQLVDNVWCGQGTRTPLLGRDDARNQQPFRMNPWGIAGGAFPTSGLSTDLVLQQEQRLVGRFNVDWHVDRYNRVKFGGEAQWSRVNSFLGDPTVWSLVYSEDPVRFAAYAQDRLDLGDVVLELGLRWDHFDSRAFFPMVPGRIFSHPDFDPANPTTLMRQAEPHSALSPRLRVSFPVTDRTNFRLSYAHQVQAPDAEAMFAGKNNDFAYYGGFAGGDVDFGKTILFEFGLRHAFSPDFAVDVSAYYKSKAQDFAYRILPIEDPVTNGIRNVSLLTNADFGSSRGIDVGLLGRISNWLSGQLAYTIQQSKGTGSNPYSYLTTQGRVFSTLTGDRLPPAQAFLRTNQDRSHSISGSLTLNFPHDFADGSWFAPIIQDAGVFARFRAVSGLPYTRFKNDGNGIITFGGTTTLLQERVDDTLNESSLPWTKYLDVRLTRGFGFRGTRWNVFADFRNLLNFTNTIGIYAATGTTVNEQYQLRLFDPEMRRLSFEAAGRDTIIAKGSWSQGRWWRGETLTAVNLRPDCSSWEGPGGVVDCLLLRNVEARFGNGDQIYDEDEQRAALNAWYTMLRGVHYFSGDPRHIRVGIEVNF